MKKTKEELEQAEKDFQVAQEKWYETGNKTYRDKMFLLIQDCCSNIMKSKLKGVKCNDFEGKVLDATLDIIKTLDKKQERINKLSSYCYFPSIHFLYSKKEQFHDRMYSLDAFYENIEE